MSSFIPEVNNTEKCVMGIKRKCQFYTELKIRFIE